MKTAVFSGMFKAFPLERAIQAAGEVGYDAVEIMVGFGADHIDSSCSRDRADEIVNVAEDSGIALCLIYTSLGGGIVASEERRDEDLDEIEKFLDIGDWLACKMLKVTAGRLHEHEYKEDEARVVADWLAAAADRAAARDARIVAEIHFGQYCETVEMARRMIDMVDHPNFGVIHDAGNLHITGDMYGEDSVEVLGGKIFHVHIKDMVHAPSDDLEAHDYLAGRFKRALLNEGDVDHLSLFRGLKKIGYDGYLSCEASGGDDAVAVAEHELAEVRKLLSQV